MGLGVLTSGCAYLAALALDENVRMGLSRPGSADRHLHVVTFSLSVTHKLLVRLLLLRSGSNSLHIVLAWSKGILVTLARGRTTDSTNTSLHLVREVVRFGEHLVTENLLIGLSELISAAGSHLVVIVVSAAHLLQITSCGLLGRI